MRPIINIANVEFTVDLRHGDRFEARIAPVGERLGAKKLGYNITVVPPGKRAFPFHNHHTNEEMFLMLEGRGRLRYGTDEYPVSKGDIVACPPGGPEAAHQFINDGDTELRYLALSTTLDTDVFQYPDSGKFGVVSGRLPGTRQSQAPFNGFFIEDTRVDYWEGE